MSTEGWHTLLERLAGLVAVAAALGLGWLAAKRGARGASLGVMVGVLVSMALGAFFGTGVGLGLAFVVAPSNLRNATSEQLVLPLAVLGLSVLCGAGAGLFVWTRATRGPRPELSVARLVVGLVVGGALSLVYALAIVGGWARADEVAYLFLPLMLVPLGAVPVLLGAVTPRT